MTMRSRDRVGQTWTHEQQETVKEEKKELTRQKKGPREKKLFS